jgi:P27 family predicted phage terminase small subunit
MGRPKVPLERMAAKSPDGVTPGKRHLPAKVTMTVDRTVPEPPASITGRGLEEWDKIWRAGWWLMRDQDYHWVEMIAQAYSDIEVYRAQVLQDGLITKGYAGQDAEHPMLAAIRKCQATIQKCLQILGFSPTDRAKLAITQRKAMGALQEMMAAANES